MLFERNENGKLFHSWADSVIFDEWFEDAKDIKEINYMIRNMMEDICNSAMDRANDLGIDSGELEFEF